MSEVIEQLPKFCKDCKHCEDPFAYDSGHIRCQAPANFSSFNLVTGEKQYKLPFCIVARKREEGCGLEAKWFEIKEVVVSTVKTKQEKIIDI